MCWCQAICTVVSLWSLCLAVQVSQYGVPVRYTNCVRCEISEGEMMVYCTSMYIYMVYRPVILTSWIFLSRTHIHSVVNRLPWFLLSPWTVKAREYKLYGESARWVKVIILVVKKWKRLHMCSEKGWKEEIKICFFTSNSDEKVLNLEVLYNELRSFKAQYIQYI